MEISKYKLKNYLAEKVANNLLQKEEEDLYQFIRYDGVKGFEQYTDDELFKMLQETIPEFNLVECTKTDNNNFYLKVRSDHDMSNNDIVIDITRIIQMKMLA